jgi:very-short-patch-repair endonuclease
MSPKLPRDRAAGAPPPERGRSAHEVSRVGVQRLSKFNRTSLKTATARRLRRDSTDVEMRLWQRLRNKQLGVDFRRQHPAGPYVLDFYCPALCLAIELDGGQHGQSSHARRDETHTRWLAERNVSLLRYWNSDVTQNLSGVLEDIAIKVAELQSARATPTRRWRADLPLSGGGDSRQDPNQTSHSSSRQRSER